MDKSTPFQIGSPQRVFLRVRKEFPAEIFIEGGRQLMVKVADLSSTGLSFTVCGIEHLPDFFMIKFKLGFGGKDIKILVKRENERNTPEGLRVGCSFWNFSNEDKDAVDKFIYRLVDISMPHTVLNTALWLVMIDVFWRFIAFITSFYYRGTAFGGSFQWPYLESFYGAVLALYAFFATAAFIFEDKIFERKVGKGFLVCLFSMVPVFTFIMLKVVIYWWNNYMFSEFLFLRVFFMFYMLFAVYVGFAIVVGIVSLEKIQLAKETLADHTRGMQKREDGAG